jgi:hypothetical protein
MVVLVVVAAPRQCRAVGERVVHTAKRHYRKLARSAPPNPQLTAQYRSTLGDYRGEIRREAFLEACARPCFTKKKLSNERGAIFSESECIRGALRALN